MQTIKFLFLAFLDFIAAIFIGAILGVLIGNAYFNEQGSGTFAVWKSLDSSRKFTQIVDATPYEILAESTEGKIYTFHAWDCRLKKQCGWAETGEVRLDWNEDAYSNALTIKKESCQHEEFVKPRYTPGNVVECVFTYRQSIDVSISVYYALLDDGTISYWLSQWDGSVFFFYLVIGLLVGGAAGLLAGMVIVVRKEVRGRYG